MPKTKTSKTTPSKAKLGAHPSTSSSGRHADPGAHGEAAASSSPYKAEDLGLDWPTFYAEEAARLKRENPQIKGRQVQKRAGAAYRRRKHELIEEKEAAEEEKLRAKREKKVVAAAEEGSE
ncbi:hypothetical protein JCM6882_004462 [Rhodosporidiobolus microsporus]